MAPVDPREVSVDEDDLPDEQEEEEEDAQDDDNEHLQHDELGNNDDDNEDDDDDDNPYLHLPQYVLPRVDKLKSLDTQRDSIMDEYNAKRAALEQEFAALLQPLYEERCAIVKGDQDEEIKIQYEEGFPEQDNSGDNGNEPPLQGVPHFWVTAISNHETIGERITEDDVECLEHLQDIRCVDDEDGKGFTLYFHFAPNDYFRESVLTKSYQVPNLLLSDEPMIQQVQGCSITWKDQNEHCLTHRTFQKKQRGKGKRAGQVRTITKTEKKESFFHFFEAPDMPATVEGLDEEEVDMIEEQFTDDFDVAQSFRCEICPRAVLWYTGEASEREMLEMMEAAAAASQDED